MAPTNPPWWHDRHRRQLMRHVLRQLRRERAAHGERVTWEETADGVRVFLNGRFDHTLTLEEIRAIEAINWAVAGDAAPDASHEALVQEALRRHEERQRHAGA
jgi:hypothetical protein